VIVVGLVVLMAGCSLPAGSQTSAAPGAPIAVGSSTRTITVAGAERTFRIYRPASLPLSRPVPLVVMIHGGGGTAAGAERAYGWDTEVDSQHFLVADPDGLNRGWSVGGGCCHFRSTDSNDVAFISQLVSTVSHELPIDPTRIYATGISEGGMMSYRLACQTTTFAAIGPDSATLLGGCPFPAPSL
jgi:polyhydroxybutyrate depolymerase